MEKEETKVPKNECKGCQHRDEMLMNFAIHIDKLNDEIEELKKQLAHKQRFELAA